MTEHFLVERAGSTALLTFNRPDARNSMTFEMYEALHDACVALDADPAVRVLVLSGAGDRAFASGTDIVSSSTSRRARMRSPTRRD